MSRKIIWFGLGGIVLAALLALVVVGQDDGLVVQTGIIGREDIESWVSANGKIQAVKKVDLSANAMGRVTRLVVKEGDVVKAGDFLMEIDPVRLNATRSGSQANLDAAISDSQQVKARLIQAQKDDARAEINFKEGIISQSDHDQAKTALETNRAALLSTEHRVSQARASLAEVQNDLVKTVLRAPMDGVVTAKRIEQGETAVTGVQNQPGTVLLTISDMSQVEAEMEVDEASIPNVKQGQAVLVRIDAYPSQTFDGEVTEVGGSPLLAIGTQEATKFKVKVHIKNPPSTIKPGLSVQAEIHTGRQEKVLVLPIQALVTRDLDAKSRPKNAPTASTGAQSTHSTNQAREEEGVYLLNGKRVKFVPVKTGLLGYLKVEITSGIRDGDVLVTGPFRILRELKDGQEVRVDRSRPDEKK